MRAPHTRAPLDATVRAQVGCGAWGDVAGNTCPAGMKLAVREPVGSQIVALRQLNRVSIFVGKDAQEKRMTFSYLRYFIILALGAYSRSASIYGPTGEKCDEGKVEGCSQDKCCEEPGPCDDFCNDFDDVCMWDEAKPECAGMDECNPDGCDDKEEGFDREICKAGLELCKTCLEGPTCAGCVDCHAEVR